MAFRREIPFRADQPSLHRQMEQVSLALIPDVDESVSESMPQEAGDARAGIRFRTGGGGSEVDAGAIPMVAPIARITSLSLENADFHGISKNEGTSSTTFSPMSMNVLATIVALPCNCCFFDTARGFAAGMNVPPHTTAPASGSIPQHPARHRDREASATSGPAPARESRNPEITSISSSRCSWTRLLTPRRFDARLNTSPLVLYRRRCPRCPAVTMLRSGYGFRLPPAVSRTPPISRR